MKDNRDAIIDLIVKLHPFEIICETYGGCIPKDHPAEWFVLLSCGCLYAACQRVRDATEQVFTADIADTNNLVCNKCQIEYVNVNGYQPVPMY